jgi:nicotinamidase-related amidase
MLTLYCTMITMNTALLVIDVQQSFPQRDYWSAAGLPEFLEAQNRLIHLAASAGIPIVRVFHEEPNTGTAFDPALGWVKPLDGLTTFAAAHEIRKHRHSALVGTDLTDWLRANQIDRLVVSGIRTEQCCETTTRNASDEGFDVDYVTEATLTFDMHHADGTVFAASDIKQRTETVLRDRFAAIVNVDEAVHRAVAANNQSR